MEWATQSKSRLPLDQHFSQHKNTLHNLQTSCTTCRLGAPFMGNHSNASIKRRGPTNQSQKPSRSAPNPPTTASRNPAQKERKRRLISHANTARQRDKQQLSHLTITAQFLVALMEKEKRSAGKPGERDGANHRNREDELNPIASSPKPSPSK